VWLYRNAQGSAQRLLSYLGENEVNLNFMHIETRDDLSLHDATAAVFEVNGLDTDPHIKKLIDNLPRASVLYHTVLCSYEIPWVPTKLQDLDLIAGDCLFSGTQLSCDHPGFSDEEYKKRRNEISQIASQYKTGQPIPTINYKPSEIATWSTVWDHLTRLHSTHTCHQYQQGFMKLVANTNTRRDNIPQIQELSDYLTAETGFSLRPVTGLLSSRHFLAGLALRVFHSTQYIRHNGKPFYTPEPDIIHEIFGHVPMFLDPDFANFSQAVGLASLGASDEFVKYLAACYWYTIEFGLIKQKGKPRAFGAGCLSSVSELENCMSSNPQIIAFDPHNIIEEYPITELQPHYYIVQDFGTLKNQIEDLAKVRNPQMHWTATIMFSIGPSTSPIPRMSNLKTDIE